MLFQVPSLGSLGVASWVVPHAERPQFHGPLLKRTRCQHTSLKENLWMKAQDEGALTPACIIQKNPQVPQTFRQVACHPVNNSKGKRRSIPQQKTRCDSLVPTLQGPWDPSQKRRGSLRFLRPLEMRPSSIAPHPVESREVPTNSTVSLSSQRLLNMSSLHMLPKLSPCAATCD